MTVKGNRKEVRSAKISGLCALVLALAGGVRADIIEMQNGDRYFGRVLSLGADTLTVQSEVLGVLHLPRARISTIMLDSSTTTRSTNAVRRTTAAPFLTNPARTPTVVSTNVSADFAAAMRQLQGSSNVVQHVQDHLLAGAGPEAQSKFDDLMGGLLSGKINVDDLRAQAKSTMEQARNARNELGDQGGSMLDSYLAILDKFLKETEPVTGTTNIPDVSPPGVQKPDEDQ